MTRPILLLLCMIAAFMAAEFFLGFPLVYLIGYGAFAILALVISGTFLWLWVKRSTPLALGMAFGWAGAACVMAWWWLYNLLSGPEWMRENPFFFVFLSVYLVGAILHLEVIGRSFALSRHATFAPVVGAVVLSVLIAINA